MSAPAKLSEFFQTVRAATLGIAVVAFLQLIVLSNEPGIYLGAAYLFSVSIPTLALAYGLQFVRESMEFHPKAMEVASAGANIVGFTAFLGALGSLTLVFGRAVFVTFTAVNLISIGLFAAYVHKARTRTRAERRHGLATDR